MRNMAGVAETRSPSAGVLHVAVVHGAQRIHFVAVAEGRAAVLRRIADYVRRQADTQLYPEDSRVLARLLAHEQVEPAIRFYFDRVGHRWDREWLDERAVAVTAGETVPR
jgi:hypothetical protein